MTVIIAYTLRCSLSYNDIKGIMKPIFFVKFAIKLSVLHVYIPVLNNLWPIMVEYTEHHQPKPTGI